MLVNGYKPEFYDGKVRKMRNLSNVYICGSPFVMSRTDAQNGLYSIYNVNRELFSMFVYVSTEVVNVIKINQSTLTMTSPLRRHGHAYTFESFQAIQMEACKRVFTVHAE